MRRALGMRLAIWGGLALLGGLAFGAAFSVMWSRASTEAYRARLGELRQEHEALRARYREAVRRTAVSELIVEDGSLRVRVRDLAGTVREIPTDFDPSGEIYVDFVVLDGRLWIRRIFDADTPPSKGLLIDPSLAGVAFDADEARVGKAVYRSLDEGRWVVSVTGNGSLGLTRAGEPEDLVSAPQVGEFDEDAGREVRGVGAMDILRRLAGVE